MAEPLSGMHRAFAPHLPGDQQATELTAFRQPARSGIGPAGLRSSVDTSDADEVGLKATGRARSHLNFGQLIPKLIDRQRVHETVERN